MIPVGLLAGGPAVAVRGVGVEIRWPARDFRVRGGSLCSWGMASSSLSHRKSSGAGRVRDVFGPVVIGRHGSGVRCARCRSGRMCGVRPVGAMLHIRLGPANGGSLESCGNALALNVVEILPCAERPPLHMGASPLKTNTLGITPESCGKLRIGPRERRAPMCSTPATGPRGSRTAREGPRWEAGPARIPREAAPTAPVPGPEAPVR